MFTTFSENVCFHKKPRIVNCFRENKAVQMRAYWGKCEVKSRLRQGREYAVYLMQSVNPRGLSS